MIQVYLAQNEMDAYIIKGLLEGEGIKAFISSANNNIPARAIPTSKLPFGVYVRKDKEEEAKKILESRESIE
jgi:hypothetical protein